MHTFHSSHLFAKTVPCLVDGSLEKLSVVTVADKFCEYTLIAGDCISDGCLIHIQVYFMSLNDCEEIYVFEYSGCSFFE